MRILGAGVRAACGSGSVLLALMLAILLGSGLRAQAQYSYITNLTVNPASLVGGASSSGTVTISSAAGSGGQVVTLSSNNTCASVPASVTVAAGATSASFTVTTTTVTSLQNVTIGAVMTSSYGYTSSRTVNLAVSPSGGGGGAIVINSLVLSPGTLIGGRPTQGNVTLSAAAPTGGFAVSLSCSNNAAVALGSNTTYVVNATPFPTSVTVPQGQTSVSFWLNTSTVNYTQTFTVTAANTAATSSVSASLTLQPANLRVTDYVMPTTMKLAWDAPSVQGYYTLVRTLMTGSPPTRGASTTVATVPSSTTSYADAYSFVNGATYLYELFDTNSTGAMGTFLSRDMVTPFADSVTENQTVDSRLDLRYSAVHYKDFKFGTRIYRGGLFTGFAAPPDQSSVARSFAKFSVSAAPAGTSFRAGSVNLYYTGSPGSVSNLPIGCQAIANSDWSSPDLVWTLAPLVTPGSATATASLNWDRANPAPQWTAWSLPADIRNAAQRAASGGDARLSVAVGSPNETQAGWAYFAKKEYDPTRIPALTHVWDWAVPIRLFVCSTSTFNPSTQVTQVTYVFTVLINGLNPGESATVALAPSGSAPITSLINTFNGSYTYVDAYVNHVPTSVTYNGITANAEPYPGTSPCQGGQGPASPVMPPQ